MRLCCVFHGPTGPSVGAMEHLDAPPTVEFTDPTSLVRRTRVLERLTRTADPVNGIVFYEEVVR